MNEPAAPEPDLPTEEMEANGWVRTAQEKGVVSESSFGPISVEALGHTLQYGDQGLVDQVRASDVTVSALGQSVTRELREVAPGAIDQYLALLVVTRIDFGPDVDNMPLGLGRAEVMGQVRSSAQESFVTTMEDTGLQNIEQTETATLEIATGQTATRWAYQADFPIEGGTATVGGEELEIPASRLKMAGHLAVWHHEDWVLVGAGAHPAENYSETFTEELSTGDTAEISLDFGLTPADYRTEILGYISQLR